MSKKSTYRFDVLDSFRGLCAIFVVVYHLKVTSGFSEYDFFRGSSLFVEFFFVLSGFVLTHGYAYRSNLGFKNFIISRAFRLFPLHIALLAVFISFEICKWLMISQFNLNMNNPAFTQDYSPEHIVPNMLLIHAWFDSLNPLSFNTPSWSISIEFYMYVFLFLTLLVAIRNRWLLWLIISAVAYTSLWHDIQILTPEALRGLSCFFAGALCYLIFKTKSFHKIKLRTYPATFLEIATLITVFYVVQSDIPNKSIIASLTFLVAILIFVRQEGYLSEILQVNVLNWLGKLSYSVYMVHGAVIYVATSLVVIINKLLDKDFSSTVGNERFFDFGGTLENNLFIVSILGIVVACSWCTYRLIELPGQKLGKTLITNNSK